MERHRRCTDPIRKVAMRNLWFASVMLALTSVTTIVWAADTDASSAVANGEAESNALNDAIPPAVVDPLADIPGRPDAKNLAIDELWNEFELAFATFESDLDATADAPPDTQTGFRNYVQAIRSAKDVRDLLGALLDGGELNEEEELDALDSYLTIAQVAGSLMVEIQQCERGADTLRELSNNPDTLDRPLLLQGTVQWLAKAERCIERQRLQTQIAERESMADEQELERLRNELAQAVSEDKRITESEQADADDQLVLTRAELLALLRESADERRRADQGPWQHPRAHLPSHEYGFSFRGGVTHFPNFVLEMVYERHGESAFQRQFGGSFFVRKNERKRDIALNYDYTSLDFGEAWWLRKSKRRSTARWTELHSSKHTITVSLDRNFPIGKSERFQFHIGGLFGFSLMPNLVDRRMQVNAGNCLVGVSGSIRGHAERFDPGGACYDEQDPSRTDRVGIPKVLPSLGLRLGMRYVIADRVQLGVEGGFHDFYFYSNASIGVIVGRQYKNR